MQLKDGINGGGHVLVLLARIVSATFIGFGFGFAVVAAANVRNRHHRKRQTSDQKIIPLLQKSGSSRFDRIERFSDFVARQIGFENPNECPELCKLANNYLKQTKGCQEAIFEFFSYDPEAKSLFTKLIEEFDRYILAYFSYHWSQTPAMITQVLRSDSDSDSSKKLLKDMVMAATRKQRLDKVSKELKMTSLFSTLVKEMKLIGNSIPSNDDSHCTDVMVPAALSERSPVLLLMGGGMGAGKSTVLKEIMKESFWAGAAGKAVVVEADAFKEKDVIYRALSSKGPHDMLQTSELVHQSSTVAASSLLVTALNEGRDVIMDGTLSWEPFVEQTIAMARNVHHHRYQMGVGYKVTDDGTTIENYWEQVEDDDEENQEQEEAAAMTSRKPYRIELLGVVCDPHLAVVRGIRRAIIMGRAVRVKSQLKSHKRFANGFPKYCQLVDSVKLYCTNSMGGQPKLIGWKDGENNLLVDPQEIDILKTISTLNEDAESVDELYSSHHDQKDKSGSVWKETLSPSRAHIQDELKIAIQKAENP